LPGEPFLIYSANTVCYDNKPSYSKGGFFMSLRTLLASAELSSASGIYALLNRVNNDDKTLYCLLRMLMMKGGITREVANEALESICYFYTDSPNKFMASFARAAVDKLEGVKEREAILAQNCADLTGVQMVNSTGRAYIVFLPDASEPGRVRYSCFDAGGFFSHSTFDTYDEALEDAWRSGFRTVSEDVLSAMSLTDDWAVGSEYTAMVQQINLAHDIEKRMVQ
jgi:hypothetical protein